MAHPQEKRTQLRGLYVFQRLPMDAACIKAKVARGTANRWKREAAAEGDDWDKARAAVALGDDNMTTLMKRLLEDYLVQHQSTIELMRDATDMSAMAKAETLASLSDSFNKTMTSFKRLSPEINKQSIALDVLERLVEFTKKNHPKEAVVLMNLISPFGEELARVYG